MIKIEWYDQDGKFHTDLFCTREEGIEVWGDIVGELSYVNLHANPRQGLLRFLEHLPFGNVKIQDGY